MTPTSIKAVIDGILLREGSKFTNTKGDRGGPTKFGITLETLAKWREGKVTADDVANLTEEEAREIYEAMYITDPGFLNINDDGLASLMIDWGVMSGPDDGVKALQLVLNAHGAGLKTDGVFGPRTAAAANSFALGRSFLRNAVVDAKILFHIDDVVKHPEQLQWLSGWTKRTLLFRAN